MPFEYLMGLGRLGGPGALSVCSATPRQKLLSAYVPTRTIEAPSTGFGAQGGAPRATLLCAWVEAAALGRRRRGAAACVRRELGEVAGRAGAVKDGITAKYRVWSGWRDARHGDRVGRSPRIRYGAICQTGARIGDS
jgi:hypothetical protein